MEKTNASLPLKLSQQFSLKCYVQLHFCIFPQGVQCHLTNITRLSIFWSNPRGYSRIYPIIQSSSQGTYHFEISVTVAMSQFQDVSHSATASATRDVNFLKKIAQHRKKVRLPSLAATARNGHIFPVRSVTTVT